MHPAHDQSWKGTCFGFLATAAALVAQVSMTKPMLCVVLGGLLLYAALILGLRVIAGRIISGPHEGSCGCLKTWPDFFASVWDGIKRFELRRNDRGYEVGQLWCLNEFDPHEGHPEGGFYTGRWIKVRITYIVRGPIWGLADGWCVWGFDVVSRGGFHVH